MESQWLSLLVMGDPLLLVPFLYEKAFTGTEMTANPCFWVLDLGLEGKVLVKQ